MLGVLAAMAMAMQVGAAAPRFPICGEGRRITCVVDGDTFWHKRIKYRIADIDAPEVTRPECAREARMAEAATYRLAELLNAGPFYLMAQGEDRYGRTLVTLTRAGHSLGEKLVSEGLARRWGDRRGWC